MATIEIEAGKIYRASFATRGISPRGDWELVKVTDEKQRNDITIFPDNIPCGVTQGMEFEVVNIRAVKSGPKKRKDGSWREETSIKGTIKPAAASSFVLDDDTIDDGELPWTLGNPFGVSEDDKLPL